MGETKFRTRKEMHRKQYKFAALRDWLAALFIVAAVMLFVFGVCLRGMAVSADNMSPLLQYGDKVYLDTLTPRLFTPKRGEMIAYEAEDGSLQIGRILALPGEEVQVQGGTVFIGGIGLDESSYRSAPRADALLHTVSPRTFTVFSDVGNAPAVSVPFDRLVGVVRLRIAPTLTLFF